jgi:UDPglucose 6-dehydrogenase
MRRNISVIGLGKLGAPLCAVLAEAGHHVIGLDLVVKSVEAMNAGRAPVIETGLQSLLDKVKHRITATKDYDEAIGKTDVTFVIVPTPSESDGMFTPKYVLAACTGIGEELRKKSTYHLVVITSTVTPGDTNGIIKETLELYSGKKCGVDFGLCYNPEFIALGDVINGLRHPDMLLIGEFDRRSGDDLLTVYEGWGNPVDNVPVKYPGVQRMSLINAEITKIAVNSYVTMKISFANSLARLTSVVPGADVDAITNAIGEDSRIGTKYLKGGLGFGGPCFPRDNIALQSFANMNGLTLPLALATDECNSLQNELVLDWVTEQMDEGSVGILGVTYKPNTPVVEESQSLRIARMLQLLNYEVYAYDPMFNPLLDPTNKNVIGVNFCKNITDVVNNSDVLIVATPWPFFDRLPAATFQDKPILDCWRILSDGGERVTRLGVHG